MTVKQPSQKSPWIDQNSRCLTPEAMNFLQSIVNVLEGVADGSYTRMQFGLFNIWIGAGTPQGNVTASRPDIYLRTNGGVGSTVYYKTTDGVATGWQAVP